MDDKQLLNELKGMKDRMDVLYSQSCQAQESGTQTLAAGEVDWWPLMDIWETEGEWVMVADLPGVSDEDLQVEVNENGLTVEGKRETLIHRRQFTASQSERPAGRFCRKFIMPSNVRKEAIIAEFKRGVLTITIPKDRTSPVSSYRVTVRSE